MAKNIFQTDKNLGELDSSTDDFCLEKDPEKDIAVIHFEKGQKQRKYWYFLILSFVMSLILIFQLLNLQIVQGLKNQFLAQGNWLRIASITAPRGLIYDKNGQKLVENIPVYQAKLKVAGLPKSKNDRDKAINEAAQIFNLSAVDLATEVAKNKDSLEPVILKDNLTHEEEILYQTKIIDQPAIEISAEPVRQYQTDGAMAHILGYTGTINQQEYEQNPDYALTDDFGKTGLEKIYEKYLSGNKGLEKNEVDAMGRYQRTISTIDPVPGKNLVLTLDYNLQKEAAKDLAASMQNVSSASGVAIAMNPQTGGILAMVSLPTYDNNLFAKGISTADYDKIKNDPGEPMINRAISGLYPSGSVIKPVIASAALQEGVVNENTTINDTGSIQVGSWSFNDWKTHGLVDIRKAIAESCDVFFYTVGGGYDKIKGLGVDKIKDYLQKFGFGSQSGIDLPSEGVGLVPDNQWKKDKTGESWYIGDTYHISIGQGYFLTTPLQIINAISAIANGGHLYSPHLVDHFTDYTGKSIESYQPKILDENFISPDNLKIVQEGMRQAVTDGTARQLQDLPVSSAGKTGTAQFGDGTKYHAWFTGYAPYENPEIAVVVMVEGGGEGYDNAEPVADQILKYYFANKK